MNSIRAAYRRGNTPISSTRSAQYLPRFGQGVKKGQLPAARLEVVQFRFSISPARLREGRPLGAGEDKFAPSASLTARLFQSESDGNRSPNKH